MSSRAELRAARRDGNDPFDVLHAVTEDQMRQALVEFFTDLAQNPADVYILAARRLSCLYLALRESGMPALPGEVYTDRDLFFLQGSLLQDADRVVIADDTVILGSTLVYLYERVKRLVSPETRIDVMAVCVDRNQCSTVLTRHIGLVAKIEQTSARVTRFSRQLTRVLFTNNVPYISDYLISDATQTSAGVILDIIRARAWMVADVTSRLADGRGASYSLIPRSPLQDVLLGNLTGISSILGENVALAKIRVYERFDGAGRSVRFVPMVLLDELTSENLIWALKDSIGTLTSEWDSVAEAVVGLNDAEQRSHLAFRMLHGLASVELARVMRTLGADEVGADAAACLHEATYLGPSTSLNFGPVLGAALNSVLDRVDSAAAKPAGTEGLHTNNAGHPGAHATGQTQVQRVRDGGVSDLIRLVRPIPSRIDKILDVPQPDPGTVARVGLTVHAISFIFSYIAETIEASERRRIRRFRSVQRFLDEFPSPRARILNQGLTVPQLVSAMGGTPSNLWHRSLVSFAVDVCNDLGLLVPSNYYDEHAQSVRRQYRIGENSTMVSPNDLLNRENWLTARLRSAVVDPFSPDPVEEVSAADARRLATVGAKLTEFFDTI